MADYHEDCNRVAFQCALNFIGVSACEVTQRLKFDRFSHWGELGVQERVEWKTHFPRMSIFWFKPKWRSRYLAAQAFLKEIYAHPNEKVSVLLLGRAVDFYEIDENWTHVVAFLVERDSVICYDPYATWLENDYGLVGPVYNLNQIIRNRNPITALLIKSKEKK